MAKTAKRQSLFTKYEFEIGVVTLPVYFSLLIMGFVLFETRPGVAFTVLGIIGTIASAFSIVKGYESIKW